MKRIVLSLSFLLQAVCLFAQKQEQRFDYAFKPTQHAGRYYVITELKDSLWLRQAWYLPERSMAMEGWYKDKECKIPHGEVRWFHTNKHIQAREVYLNGVKEGTWFRLGEQGELLDSATYVAGRLKGVRLQWYADGMLSDSMNFDGVGNGVEVSWHEDGTPSSAGHWVSDTAKNGRWKYYHTNGKIMATEDYANGRRTDWKCYDENGQPLDTAGCPEKEAEFTDGQNGWMRFLQRNLDANAPVRNKAPLGQFTVVVQFVVGKDGQIENIKPLTRFGFGMEEEAVRILKISPRWVPAQQFGRRVRAYRKQPITFVVTNG